MPALKNVALASLFVSATSIETMVRRHVDEAVVELGASGRMHRAHKSKPSQKVPQFCTKAFGYAEKNSGDCKHPHSQTKIYTESECRDAAEHGNLTMSNESSGWFINPPLMKWPDGCIRRKNGQGGCTNEKGCAFFNGNGQGGTPTIAADDADEAWLICDKPRWMNGTIDTDGSSANSCQVGDLDYVQISDVNQCSSAAGCMGLCVIDGREEIEDDETTEDVDERTNFPQGCFIYMGTDSNYMQNGVGCVFFNAVSDQRTSSPAAGVSKPMCKAPDELSPPA